jgi:hypothetical protein
MNDAKYIGLDVHQATISAAVLVSAGKLEGVQRMLPRGAVLLVYTDSHGLPTSVLTLPSHLYFRLVSTHNAICSNDA